MVLIILIFLAFALIHSITVAWWFKDFCRRILGDVFMRVWYRFLYTAVSAVTTAAAFFLISRIPDTFIWRGPAWLRWYLHAVQLGALIFGAGAFRYIDSREFLGVTQVWRYVTKRRISGNREGMTERGLVTGGVYGVVRHPMYLAGIIIFTFEPNITVNCLTITVLADLYFLWGVFVEERRFVRLYGDEYREYMKKVPRLIPKLMEL